MPIAHYDTNSADMDKMIKTLENQISLIIYYTDKKKLIMQSPIVQILQDFSSMCHY